MSDESEAKDRGYRYYKQLAAVRRGYGFVRDTIAEFLVNRRWELGQPDQVKVVALELVNALMEAGALSLYQCGIDVENTTALDERKHRKERELRQSEIQHAVVEAREEERRRVDARIVELNAERERERYLGHLRASLEAAEKESQERIPRRAEAVVIETAGRELPLALPPIRLEIEDAE